jgi:hypothetical protein
MTDRPIILSHELVPERYAVEEVDAATRAATALQAQWPALISPSAIPHLAEAFGRQMGADPYERDVAWLIEFPEGGDKYEGGKRVGPAYPRKYYGGEQRPDGRWISRTEDPSKAIRYCRKIDAECALGLMSDRFPNEGFVSEHVWIAAALRSKLSERDGHE